jgi:hypothetical protein
LQLASTDDHPSANKESTPPQFRRTLAFIMPAGFDAAFAKVKELVADFRANEKFHLFPPCCCDGFTHAKKDVN